MRAHVLGVILLTASLARADGQLEDPEIARRVGPPPQRGGSSASTGNFLARIDPASTGQGALAGKTIYVSAGHGWVWDDSLGRWRTQRGNTHDLVEDFISTETISQHLIPLLHDMGAYVVPVREADMSPELVLVDDAAATVEAAATTAAEGFAMPSLPLTGAANPFAGGGSRLAATAADARSVATWTLAPAADAEAFVYLSWVQGADRAPDAHYVIHHAGGDSHVRVDQRRHGSTWVLLGSYRFVATDPPARRSIELLGDSATPGAVLSIDAVRIGGGAGRVDRGMGPSGRPAFEDGSRYQAQWNGAPSTVWDYAAEDGNDDVGTRSRFSAWDHETGEDAVYVAWHTNAPSPARGTSSFAYGPSSYGPLSEFSGVTGSLELMDAIHDELVADLRAAWEPEWQDRAQHTAYFGEVNPSHNPEMPATLIEVAFHDTAADADALREPAFRHLASRAIAQGIARYFATRDGAPLTLPPGIPTRVVAHGGAQGDLFVSWSAPSADPAGGDAPSGYRILRSRDGRAFDDGIAVAAGSSGDRFDVVLGGAELGEARFVRVVADNAGGRSRPSPVAGADAREATVADVLVVAGFTRLDGAMFFHEDLSASGLGTIDRGHEDRINDGSHGARIGAALTEAGYGHAIATVDAVRRGDVTLADFRAVVWLGGEEPAPLTAEDRTALAAYLDGGGALILTATDGAAALASDDAAFLANLGAGFVADDAGTYTLTGLDDGFSFDDTGLGGYDADAPDVIAPAAGATAFLSYDATQVAATLQTGPWRAAVFGFPVETVPTVTARARILGAALAGLGLPPEPDPEPDPEPEVTDPGGCCGTSSEPASAIAPLLVALLALTRRRRLTNMPPS